MDKFLIAPLNSGLQTDQKPFLIPDDAFAQLENAYIFRGRVRKRFGATLMNTSAPTASRQLFSKLAINLGNTNGAGNLAIVVPGVTTAGRIGMQFSVGTEIFTVSVAGLPAVMLTTGAATVHTFNTTTGALVINGAAINTAVYYYPSLPVMGLTSYQQAPLNNEQTIGFDTQFAYTYTAGHWERLGTGLWTGSDAQFFWWTNGQGTLASDRYFYVTNNNDPVTYWTGAAWTQYIPELDATPNLLKTCLLVTYFKNRLITLNTSEGPAIGVNARYPNRIRWSKLNSLVTVATSFKVTTSNTSAGFLDIPIAEAITSCNIIKDRLIVFCEESTWELVWTRNESDPFIIQQINKELGVESTFSSIVFDKVILGIGNVGIHACNGANVERIDQKIPYQVFQINNANNGQVRVHGIRDYYNELVYWTYPFAGTNDKFPSKVLIFNYRTGSWATADDSITTFGNYQRQTSITWADLTDSWEDVETDWDSATFQNQFRSVIAGNQEGVVFVLQPDVTHNAAALSITDISYATAFNQPELTIINHNMKTGDFIYLSDIQGTSSFLNDRIFQVIRRVSDDVVRISAANTVLKSYNGGGVVTLVSNIMIKTKQYSFYASTMNSCYTHRVAFNVNRTSNGEITCDFYVSSGDLQMLEQASATGTLVCTGVLETSPYALLPIEQQQERLWHYVYLQAEGEYLQYLMYFTDEQMLNQLVSMRSDFQLNAITFYAQKTNNI